MREKAVFVVCVHSCFSAAAADATLYAPSPQKAYCSSMRATEPFHLLTENAGDEDGAQRRRFREKVRELPRGKVTV